MSPKPLEILKQGFWNLSQKIKKRKDELDAKLKRSETISSADEQWLDNEANIIDEQCVLEQLESASDYERGVTHLDDKGKAIVKKLKEWAGELPKITGKKCMRMANFGCLVAEEADIFRQALRGRKKSRFLNQLPLKQLLLL